LRQWICVDLFDQRINAAQHVERGLTPPMIGFRRALRNPD
jgi:hypothetical protein